MLRIIAMFLVLIFHADFWSLGKPSIEDITSSPLSSFARIFFESASAVCVNVFVMISGWFGIRATLRGFTNFIFQFLYFTIGIYLVMLQTGMAPLSGANIADCLGLRPGTWWFVTSYMALYILSPVLNTYADTAGKRKLGLTLIAFYGFQTFYGWTSAAEFIVHGYSAFSFIGLYLLARWLRLYGEQRLMRLGALIYFAATLCTVATYYVSAIVGHIQAMSYVSIFVVTASAGLVMWTSCLKMSHSRVINYVAASAFAVYLLHVNPLICDSFFKPLIRSIYDTFNPVECLTIIFGALAAIFAVAVILDQPRRLIWSWIDLALFGRADRRPKSANPAD